MLSKEELLALWNDATRRVQAEPVSGVHRVHAEYVVFKAEIPGYGATGRPTGVVAEISDDQVRSLINTLAAKVIALGPKVVYSVPAHHFETADLVGGAPPLVMHAGEAGPADINRRRKWKMWRFECHVASAPKEEGGVNAGSGNVEVAA